MRKLCTPKRKRQRKEKEKKEKEKEKENEKEEKREEEKEEDGEEKKNRCTISYTQILPQPYLYIIGLEYSLKRTLFLNFIFTCRPL